MGSLNTNHRITLSGFRHYDGLHIPESVLSYDYSGVIPSKFSKGISNDDENGKLFLSADLQIISEAKTHLRFSNFRFLDS